MQCIVTYATVMYSWLSKISSGYKFFGTCHPGALYLREQGCLYPWLFFEPKRGPLATEFWKLCSRHIATSTWGVQVLRYPNFFLGEWKQIET